MKTLVGLFGALVVGFCVGSFSVVYCPFLSKVACHLKEAGCCKKDSGCCVKCSCEKCSCCAGCCRAK